MKLPYEEGSVFCLPLETGGWASGLVARMNPKGGCLFGYFFGPRLTQLPNITAFSDVSPQQAVYRKLFGDLGLIDGTWCVLGTMPGWDREEWPMLPLLRKPWTNENPFVEHYDPNDPSKLVRHGEVVPGADYAESGLAGAGFVEEKLDSILSQ